MNQQARQKKKDGADAQNLDEGKGRMIALSHFDTQQPVLWERKYDGAFALCAGAVTLSHAM